MNSILFCRLCLNETDAVNCLNIFDEIRENLNVASIITKHFWFEPQFNHVSDKGTNIICRKCWNILENFHNFYEEIKEAHSKLIEQTDIKLQVEDLKIEIDPTLVDQNHFDYDTNISPINQNFIEFEEKVNLNEVEEIASDSNVVGEKSTNRKSTRLKNKTQKSIKLKNTLNKKSELPSKKNLIEKSKVKDAEKIKLLKINLEKEDKLVSSYMKLICSICSTELKTFTDIKRHYKSEHNEVGYVICCEKKFYRRFLFVDHIKLHICPDDIKCDICGKKFQNNAGIQAHIKNVHSKRVSKFDCDVCNGTFSTKSGLTRHKLLHIPKENWTFKCNECEKCFPSDGLLQTHMNIIHKSRYSSICDLCGKIYQSPQDLKRHRLEHDGIRPPKAQCEICGFWLSNKYKLQRHMYIHIPGEFKCNLCNKIAPNPPALKSHILATHQKKRIHKCNICAKVFLKTLDLKEHMTVHTGETLYVCPHCPRTFTHHSNMHHHRKKMHRKEFDEERKNRAIRQMSWNKETEIKKPPTSIPEDAIFTN